MASEKVGLSNLQHELLKLYGNNVSEESLKEIRTILARYFAERASDAMDKVWEDQHLSPHDMLEWANGHDRVKDRS